MANVLLIGMGTTALSALDSLSVSFKVLGVVRCLSEPSGTDPVAARAVELGIPIFSNVSPADVDSAVKRLRPDCVVVSSYNRILRSETLGLSRFVNVHYSPLPLYRGRANVNWAIINDEAEAAISIHEITPGLDAGNILFQQRIPIRAEDSVADLYSALNDVQRDHLANTVLRFLEGYAGDPQIEIDATYGCTRLPDDGEIDWQATTTQIGRLVRALVEPFPGAFTYFKGQRLIVWKTAPVENPPHYAGRIPGRVVGVDKSDGYVDVLTGDGVLRVFEIQPEGAARTAAANVVRSVSDTLGLRMADLHKRVQALELQIFHLVKSFQG